MTKRQSLRIACFAFIAVLLLLALGNFLRDKKTTLSSFYSVPNNSVDVFVVGSSHVNSASIPGIMWADYGVSAHNVFSWSQPMWISYHYIKEGLKTQTPKVVALNMHGMMYGNSMQQPDNIDDVNYKNSFTIDPGINFLQMTKTVETCGIDLRDSVDFLNLVRFHSRWKYVDEDFFTYNAHNDPSFLAGYGIQVLQMANSQKPAYAPTSNIVPPYETCIKYLDKIVELSKKEDFELVFVMMPYMYQENEPAIFNWISRYAVENDIPFINYCEEDGERIGFDWGTELADENHLNYMGAIKVSRDLGEYLSSNYSLTLPENNPAKNQFDMYAEQMLRTLDINDAVLQGKERFFAWMKDSGSTIILLQNSGLLTLPENSFMQAIPEFEALAANAGKDGLSYLGIKHPDESREILQQEYINGEFSLGENTLFVNTKPENGMTEIVFNERIIFSDELGMIGIYYDNVLNNIIYLFEIYDDGTVTVIELTSEK